MLDFDNQISKIGGWLTKKEGLFLYNIAKNLSKGSVIVEIGSWKGRSTICLGEGSKEGGGVKIYAVDPHTGSKEHRKWFGKVDTYQEFLNNIQRFEVDKYIQPLRLTSKEAALKLETDVDFLFIDGAHDYKNVKEDFKVWFPRLKDGGLIAFHDSWHAPGVHWFTALLLIESSNVKDPQLIDSLTFMTKAPKASFLLRAYNILFVIYRLFLGWIGTLKIDYFGTVLDDPNRCKTGK